MKNSFISILLFFLLLITVNCSNENAETKNNSKDINTNIYPLIKKCLSCHVISNEKYTRRTTGPNLYDIYMKKSASRYDYNYSSALKNAEIIWTKENLDQYLLNPHKFIKGNKMSFSGINDKMQRELIIEFLIDQSEYEELENE